MGQKIKVGFYKKSLWSELHLSEAISYKLHILVFRQSSKCVGMLKGVQISSNKSSNPMVLYMSFDRFLLAVESRDLSKADKSIKSVFFFNFTNLQFLNDKIYSFSGER